MRNCLTAEADDDDAVDIGIAGKSREDFLAHIGVGRHIGTSGVKDDVHSAAHLARHDPAALASTCTGGEDQNVVADSRSAFRSSVAPELEACKIRRAFGLPCAHDEIFAGLLALVISGDAEKVVVGDPVALPNRFGSLSEALIILDDLAALGNICQGDLVAVGDVLLSCQGEDLVALAVCYGGTCGDVCDAGDDVIGASHE